MHLPVDYLGFLFPADGHTAPGAVPGIVWGVSSIRGLPSGNLRTVPTIIARGLGPPGAILAPQLVGALSTYICPP